jgi:NAD(P)-dependent dehydrogenase (short-subunit alcohol dehydrogenase family)
LAAAVLEQGERVVVTARDPATVAELADAYPSTALPLALDVTDSAQRRAVVRTAEDRFGGIDVLVNNAGHGYRAAVEEAADAEVEELFATNFFAAVALIQAVLPSMRERRSGSIVNISSIGARSSPVGAGHYAATKAALEAVTGALRKELEPLGVRVMLVEPGAFRTHYKRSLTRSEQVIRDYAASVGARRREDSAEDGLQPGDPAKAAIALITALRSPHPPGLLLLGADAVTAFRAGAEDDNADLDAWEHLSVNTSYDAEHTR